MNCRKEHFSLAFEFLLFLFSVTFSDVHLLYTAFNRLFLSQQFSSGLIQEGINIERRGEASRLVFNRGFISSLPKSLNVTTSLRKEIRLALLSTMSVCS